MGQGSNKPLHPHAQVTLRPPLRVFRHGAAGAALCVGLSGDGALLASGGGDSKVRVWRVSDGAVVREYVHPRTVCIVSLSPSGALVASSCANVDGPAADSALRVWEVRTNRKVEWPEVQGIRMRQVCFPSVDTRLYAHGSYALYALDVETQRVTWQSRPRQEDVINHDDSVLSIHAAQDDGLLVCGGSAGMFVYDVRVGRAVARVTQRFCGSVRCSGGVVDGGRVAAMVQAEDDPFFRYSLSVYDLRSSRRPVELTFETCGLMSWLCWSSDAQALCSSSSIDYTVRMWDATQRERKAELGPPVVHPGAVCGLSLGGALLSSACADGCVRVWGMGDGRAAAALLDQHAVETDGCASDLASSALSAAPPPPPQPSAPPLPAGVSLIAPQGAAAAAAPRDEDGDGEPGAEGGPHAAAASSAPARADGEGEGAHAVAAPPGGPRIVDDHRTEGVPLAPPLQGQACTMPASRAASTHAPAPQMQASMRTATY
jgi:WD40 repeat protein